jgi:hypothetical protein
MALDGIIRENAVDVRHFMRWRRCECCVYKVTRDEKIKRQTTFIGGKEKHRNSEAIGWRIYLYIFPQEFTHICLMI